MSYALAEVERFRPILSSASQAREDAESGREGTEKNILPRRHRGHRVSEILNSFPIRNSVSSVSLW